MKDRSLFGRCLRWLCEESCSPLLVMCYGVCGAISVMHGWVAFIAAAGVTVVLCVVMERAFGGDRK